MKVMRRALAVAGLLLGMAPAEARAECSQVFVTGYTPAVGPRTADGTETRGAEWTVAAVDPSVIPLQSSVAVEGLGTFRAADTGGGVRGYWVDVLTSTVAEARAITGWYRACWWR